jgi:hypothetical protein
MSILSLTQLIYWPCTMFKQRVAKDMSSLSELIRA